MKLFFQKHQWLSKILIIIIAIGVILFLDVGCVYRHFFHTPCPGCGMTRAWISVLHGNFRMANYYHPLWWLVPILGLVFIFDDRIKDKRIESLIIIVSLILFILVYLYRLFFHLIP